MKEKHKIYDALSDRVFRMIKYGITGTTKARHFPINFSINFINLEKILNEMTLKDLDNM